MRILFWWKLSYIWGEGEEGEDFHAFMCLSFHSCCDCMTFA